MKKTWVAVAVAGLVAMGLVEAEAQDTTTMLNQFLRDLRNKTLGVINPITSIVVGNGTAAAPSLAFSSQPGTGFFYISSDTIGVSVNGTHRWGVDGANLWIALGSTMRLGWVSSATDPTLIPDVLLDREAANILALKNGTNAQTFRVFQTTTGSRYMDLAGANLVTAPTDSTEVTAGSVTRLRSSSTITPATGGAGNCGTSFAAAALTADCTVATLPAGMVLNAIYAEVTAGFACSGTCIGTKVMQCGTAAGGTQVLAAGFDVTTTGVAGDADAELGTGMVRAAAIQGGLLGSWSATTPISCRFTSGTGNWGNGTATFVNAGSIKFTLVTEQIK